MQQYEIRDSNSFGGRTSLESALKEDNPLEEVAMKWDCLR